MEHNYMSFRGLEWNAADLESSKQAVEILYLVEGIEPSVILGLNFGSLWIEAVLEEMGVILD